MCSTRCGGALARRAPTVGEVCGALREVWGVYLPNDAFSSLCRPSWSATVDRLAGVAGLLKLNR